MPAKRSAARKTPARKAPVRKRAASAKKAVQKTPANSMTFEEFKKQVIKESMEFDGGCYDGKKKFLENLGLEVPPRKAILQASFAASYSDNTSRITLQNALAKLLAESDLDIELYGGLSWARWEDE